MQMYGEKDIVMSVLDTVSFLLEVDKYANYDGERSFKHLIEVNQGFTIMQEVLKYANEHVVKKIERIFDEFRL